MAAKNEVLDMSPLGMVFTIINSAADTNGNSLDLHWEVLPGCNMKDPLIHKHPHAIETYEILEGSMEFFVKDKWIKAVKGDQVTVPVGVTHGFRNPFAQKALVFNTHQPAFKMENYFEEVVRILQKLSNNKTKEFKMDLNAKLHLGVLMNRYRNEIIAVKPPDFAVRMLGVVGKILNVNY